MQAGQREHEHTHTAATLRSPEASTWDRCKLAASSGSLSHIPSWTGNLAAAVVVVDAASSAG